MTGALTVTPLGWQFAVRRGGTLVSVYDTRIEANEAKKSLAEEQQS